MKPNIKLKFTDDKSEQMSIGKAVFEAHPDLYTPATKELLMKTINANLPVIGGNAEELLYLSLYDYWTYGCRIDEWFFYEYFKKTHEEKLEYITTRTKSLYLNHLNCQADRHLLDNKYETYEILKPYFKRDLIYVRGENDYETFRSFVSNHSKFVVKPVDSTYGRGIYKVELSEKDDIKAIFDDLWKQENVNRLCGLNSFVIEEAITEIPEVAVMHPSSVQCLRCITFLVNGEPRIFPYFYYKVGIKDQTIVNGTSGSIIAGVDSKTGKICTNGFVEKLGAPEYKIHPDTGVRFNGFSFPKWDELIALLKEMAVLLPTIRYVSWDACITKKGWCIIEANYAGEFRGMQIPFKKGLRKDLEEIIEWKPTQQFWWE